MPALLNAPNGAIRIIGVDISSVSKAHIQRVFKTLGSNNWIFILEIDVA